MKYRKRFIICNLLAGLMVWMGSCKSEPQIEFINKKDLLTFPSASSIDLYNNELYIIGDDAPFILVMDTALKTFRTVRFSPDTSYRIAKSKKHDLEASLIKLHNGVPTLFAFGSFASSPRERVFLFSLPQLEMIDSMGAGFRPSIPLSPNINLEGATLADSLIILANRGNLSQPQNYILALFSPQLYNASLIKLDIRAKSFVGISGLHYLKEKDILLFTGSQEATASTTADGAIGQSYLGWINKFQARIRESVIKPDYIMELSTLHPSLNKKKVESITAQKIGEENYLLYLVSDDDAGHSEIFKIHLDF